MTIHAIVSELAPIDVPLANIYLDPNNPRFVGSNWTIVPDNEIDDEARQQAARALLISDYGVDRLRRNIEVNGFLPIDRPIVRKFKDNKFVVLEGNRRVCAAKLVTEYSTEGETISQDVKNSLQVIQCLEYTGQDTQAAWIFQGIRHISGLVEWSSFNKARLLVEQMDRENLTLTQVGRRFGVSAQGAGQWLRGYRAFEQASEHPDVSELITEAAYPFFMELFSRTSSAVRDWMEWSDTENRFKNELNFHEYLSWLYPEDDSEELPEGHEPKRSWANRLLIKRDDVRQISYLIHDAPAYFQKFRQDLDLERAYAEARAQALQKELEDNADPVQDALKATESCVKAIERIPYRAMRDPETVTKIRESVQRLRAAADDFLA